MEASEFKELREKIEAAKSKKSRAEGSLEESMNRLKKEYGCNSVEEALELCDKIGKEIDEDEKSLASVKEEIKTSVNWDAL